MAKYLVTGGCGFIGSHLVGRLLENGDEPIVLDNLSTGARASVPRDVDVFIGDIRDESLVNRLCRGIDGCFHLAAVASVAGSQSRLTEAHEVNFRGAITVFNGIGHESGNGDIPVVYASSAAVYGDSDEQPLVEHKLPRPISAYGAQKICNETSARGAASAFKIPSVGFRIFNAYGPGQNPSSPCSGVVSLFSNKILEGNPITIYGDGNQTRDFVYVDDVISHLTAAMESPPSGGEIYNLCTGHAVSINKLTSLLFEIIGRSVKVVYDDRRAGDICHSVGSVAMAEARFGLKRKTDLELGLRATVEWMRGFGKS